MKNFIERFEPLPNQIPNQNIQITRIPIFRNIIPHDYLWKKKIQKLLLFYFYIKVTVFIYFIQIFYFIFLLNSKKNTIKIVNR